MKRIITLFAALLVAAVTLVSGTPASAASNTIGVNPRRDYTITPGSTLSDKLYVPNSDQKNDLDATIRVLDFSAKDMSGIPAIDLKSSKQTPWSLKPFLTIQNSLKLPAGQSGSVPFTISIPKNLGGGSYYSAIEFVTGSGGSSQNVSLSGAAVSLMFVTVPGQANNNLQLVHFGTYTPSSDTDGVYGSFYSATKPKYIAYDLKNLGNIAAQPKGSLLINNIFGKQYKLVTNVNPDNNLVLIGQTRRIQYCLNQVKVTKKDSSGQPTTVQQCNDPSLLPGRYTAKIDLLYGIEGGSQKELQSTASFWYLPVWFLAILLIALLIIVGIIWLIVKVVRGSRGNRYSGRR